MKKNIPLVTLIIFLLGIDNYAQCTQMATSFGNNTTTPMYNVNGDVNVTLNTDNTVTLDLGSNFTTAAGPDVRVYFINQGALTDNQLKTTLIANIENIMFGLVSSSTVNQNGAKTFTVPIPQGRDITQYNKVLFYCLNFNKLWDFGSIEPFSNSNCTVLSTNKFENNTFSMYPNPANNSIKITIDSGFEPENLKVYNILGKLILSKNIDFKNSIDISTFSEGIYIVEISNKQNEKIIKRLVKSNY